MEGNTVTLWSEGYDKPFVVDLADLSVHEEEKETTFSLIRGVAARLSQLGYRIGGFDACVTSTVFKGSGLSSSAAFEVMLVAIFDALYNGWTVDPKLNAQISKYAENVYFGKPSGLMDQMASSVGGLVTIDFLPDDPDVRALQYDFMGKGYAVCVVTVGGDHGDLTGAYAASTTEMRSVYFSAYSLISGAASLLGTTISSTLIEVLDRTPSAPPIQSLFLLGLVLLVVPFVLFRRLPQDLH